LRSVFTVREAREVGADGGHWKLTLAHGGERVDAIWFNTGSDCPTIPGSCVRLVFTPEANWWRGQRRLQIRIQARAD
jgi:single-stranded-DNA-specific exonuclease